MKEHIIYADDPESLIIGKYFVEEYLLENKIIEQKYPLNEFISKFLNFNKSMAIVNMKTDPSVVAFFIYNEMPDDVYVFFGSSGKDADIVYEKLKKINYDLSKLKPYTDEDILVRINNKEYSF